MLTGPPGIGKTTALRRIVASLGLDACAGFFTEEIRHDGARIGFCIKTLDGRSGVLADVSHESALRIGPYGVMMETLETIGLDAVRSAVGNQKIVIIDEIGPMQILSAEFRVAVLDVMRSASILVGTVVYRQVPWVDQLKCRDDVAIYPLTSENFEQCIAKISSDVDDERRRRGTLM